MEKSETQGMFQDPSLDFLHSRNSLQVLSVLRHCGSLVVSVHTSQRAQDNAAFGNFFLTLIDTSRQCFPLFLT